MNLDLTIAPRRVALLLALIAIGLAVQSISGKFIQDGLGDDSPYVLDSLVRMFNVNRESTIPTWYSTLLLAACAVLLGVIARVKWLSGDRFRAHWAGLALIFLYLSMDEAAVIHEEFTEPLGEGLATTGYLYFAWVMVGAAFFLAVALVYFRFWLSLAPRYRRLMVMAAAVYIGGALIVESISAAEWEAAGGSSMVYSQIGTVEEGMEMLGAVIFLYMLMLYAAEHVGRVSFILRTPLAFQNVDPNAKAAAPLPDPPVVAGRPALDTPASQASAEYRPQ